MPQSNRFILRALGAGLIYASLCYVFAGGVFALERLAGIVQQSGPEAAMRYAVDRWDRLLETAVTHGAGMMCASVVGLFCVMAFASSSRRPLAAQLGLAGVCGMLSGLVGATLHVFAMTKFDVGMANDNIMWMPILWLTPPVIVCVITEVLWRGRDRRRRGGQARAEA